MGHERPVEPFSDLHVEEGHVRATLLHDPSVEGLDVGLYLDGSASMKDEYANPVQRTGGGLFWELFGWGSPPATHVLDNAVEPQARWMLKYLATKDRNGRLRLAYWACGPRGRRIERLGEVTAADADALAFPGPKDPGARTELLPALEDFLTYFREQSRDGARQGCMVIVTDGEIHDADEVMDFSRRVARAIVQGELPRVNFVLVGVGAGVNEEQLEEICHEEYPGVGHLWCHRIAEEIKDVAELVAVLVDETMTIAGGGRILDDRGRLLKAYEGRLPAVLEFEVPEGVESFTLEVNGQRFTQPLPEDDDHHGDEDEDEDHH